MLKQFNIFGGIDYLDDESNIIMKQIEQVKEFREVFNVNQDINTMRKLLMEENSEYWEAIQLCVHSKEKQYPEKALIKGYTEILDALVDLKYVLYGFYVDLSEETVRPTGFKNAENINYNDYYDLRSHYEHIEELINTQNLDVVTLDLIDDAIESLLHKHGLAHLYELAFTEVHNSNMSKLEDGKPIYREDGKVLKGKDYFKPNLKQFING